MNRYSNQIPTTDRNDELIDELLCLLCIPVIKEYQSQIAYVNFSKEILYHHLSKIVWDKYNELVYLKTLHFMFEWCIKQIIDKVKTPELMLDRIKYSGEELDKLMEYIVEE